jgi:hypothetical protein
MILLVEAASVPIHPRQDPPTRHYGLRMDRNLAFLPPDDFYLSFPDYCCNCHKNNDAYFVD